MGKMSRTRRAMRKAGHTVGVLKGKKVTMECEDPKCPAVYVVGLEKEKEKES